MEHWKNKPKNKQIPQKQTNNKMITYGVEGQWWKQNFLSTYCYVVLSLESDILLHTFKNNIKLKGEKSVSKIWKQSEMKDFWCIYQVGDI